MHPKENLVVARGVVGQLEQEPICDMLRIAGGASNELKVTHWITHLRQYPEKPQPKLIVVQHTRPTDNDGVGKTMGSFHPTTIQSLLVPCHFSFSSANAVIASMIVLLEDRSISLTHWGGGWEAVYILHRKYDWRVGYSSARRR